MSQTVTPIIPPPLLSRHGLTTEAADQMKLALYQHRQVRFYMESGEIVATTTKHRPSDLLRILQHYPRVTRVEIETFDVFLPIHNTGPVND